jgi:hypothetical protein
MVCIAAQFPRTAWTLDNRQVQVALFLFYYAADILGLETRQIR